MFVQWFMDTLVSDKCKDKNVIVCLCFLVAGDNKAVRINKGKIISYIYLFIIYFMYLFVCLLVFQWVFSSGQ